MDAAIEHFVSHSHNNVFEDDSFCGGVVILETQETLDPTPGPASGTACEATSEDEGQENAHRSTFVEAGTFWDDEAASRTCNACDRISHLRATCPTPDAKMLCRGCGQKGYKKRDCPEAEARPRTYHRCRREEHDVKMCPEPEEKKVLCINCDSTEHNTAECREKCRNCGSHPDDISGHNLLDCTAGDSAAADATAIVDDDDTKFKPPRKVYPHPPGHERLVWL